MEGGDFHGLSLDPLGLSHNALPAWQYKFNKEYNNFKKSIDRHFKKIHSPDTGKPALDKVVIDFKYMNDINPTLKQQVLEYIQINHHQYNNSTYFIKINL